MCCSSSAYRDRPLFGAEGASEVGSPACLAHTPPASARIHSESASTCNTSHSQCALAAAQPRDNRISFSHSQSTAPLRGPSQQQTPRRRGGAAAARLARRASAACMRKIGWKACPPRGSAARPPSVASSFIVAAAQPVSAATQERMSIAINTPTNLCAFLAAPEAPPRDAERFCLLAQA